MKRPLAIAYILLEAGEFVEVVTIEGRIYLCPRRFYEEFARLDMCKPRSEIRLEPYRISQTLAVALQLP